MSVALIIALSHCLHSSHYLSHNYTTEFSVTSKQGSLPHLPLLGWRLSVPRLLSALSGAFPVSEDLISPETLHWGQAAGRGRAQNHF